jgi:hypothetical protein
MRLVLTLVAALAAAVLVAVPALADPDPPGRYDAVCAWGNGRNLRIETIFRFHGDQGFLEYVGMDEPGTTFGSAFVEAHSETVNIAPDGQSASVQQWLWIDENRDDWWPGYLVFCSATTHR